MERKGKSKTAGRKGTQDLGSMYSEYMGSEQNPQDHPANNVVHPGGNRGLGHATIPLNVPNSWPSHTGDWQDEVNG